MHPIIVFESHSILKKEKRNQKLQVTITFTLIMTLCKLLTTTVRPVFEMLCPSHVAIKVWPLVKVIQILSRAHFSAPSDIQDLTVCSLPNISHLLTGAIVMR